MIGGIVATVVLVLAALALIVAPLLRSDAAEAERVAHRSSEAVDLQQQREMVMGALKDLEDDHATDKITEDDYNQMHARLSARAVDIMKRQEALEAADQARQDAKTIQHPSARRDAEPSSPA